MNNIISVNVLSLFKKSTSLVIQNIKLFALIFIVGAVSLIFDALVSDFPTSTALKSLNLFTHLFYMIICLLAAVLFLGIAQGFNPTLTEIWNNLKNDWLWLKLIGLAFLQFFIMLAVAFAILVPAIFLIALFTPLALTFPFKLILFVFIGMVSAFAFAVKFLLAAYVLIDKNTKIIQALKTSWNMSKGYNWTILKIILIYCLLALPGLIPYVGGYLALIAMLFFSVVPALFYEKIKERAETMSIAPS